MKLKDLYNVSPQSFIFIKTIKDGHEHLIAYSGGSRYSNHDVVKVTARSYPGYKSVFEVELGD